MARHNSTTDQPLDEKTSENPSSEQLRAREGLRKLIDEQGVTPLSIVELDAMGDLWPEEENLDDFLAALREWRSEKSYRELP
ncbi:MAG: hypothetical protein AABO41_08935 [Acidobacteriota bacterium]